MESLVLQELKAISDYNGLGYSFHYWRTPAGNEVDIVAQEDDTIVFVEVRTRGAHDAAPPEDSINFEKQKRLRRAAHHYIARQGARDAYYRFDAVAVVIPPKGKPQLKVYRDAFH